MGVSTMFGTEKKKKFDIWVFLEVQEINFLGPLKVNMDIVYFCMDFFDFTKKFLLLLTMQVFFKIFYRTTPPPTQLTFFTDILY